MPPPLKAVFFDAVGTLIFLPVSVGEHYRNVSLRHGLDMPSSAWDDAFRACWKTMPARPARKGPRDEDDKGWWHELVGAVFERVLPVESSRPFDQEACFEELYAHFSKPGVWAAFADAEPVLHTLREQGLKLGVISNFDRRLYAVLEHLGLSKFFDAIVISSEFGADKPDPAIFEHALGSLKVLPEEAVHVGDDPKCDWGAKVAGLDLFKLDRPNAPLSGLPGWLQRRNSGQNELATPPDLS